jgi:hypothetical protein
MILKMFWSASLSSRLRLAALFALVSLGGGCSTNSPYTTTTAPTSTNGSGTDTFASFVSVGGSSSHMFHVLQAGAIAITLTTLSRPVVVGMGVGVPNASGSGCSLTNSLNAAAGTDPQLTVPAAVGTYCVEIYDSGQLGGFAVMFSATIAHP